MVIEHGGSIAAMLSDGIVKTCRIRIPMLRQLLHKTGSQGKLGQCCEQGTTGPRMLRGPPSRGQQRVEGNVMNAA